MLWSRLHENLMRDRHGDGQHLESEVKRAALRWHAPQAHRNLQRPATASPCKGLETL